MRLFPHRHDDQDDQEVEVDETPTAWPDDTLSDIDDDAFARAIAAGRQKEHDGQLIDA